MKRLLSMLLVFYMLCSMLSGCSSSSDGIYKPGDYETVSKGFGGDITVTVKVDAKDILAVTVLENSETQGIGSKAIEKMPEIFVEANSADIDTIAGCTVSSNAMKEAVENALKQAMGVVTSTQLNMNDGVYTTSVKSYDEINGLATGEGSMTMEITIEGNEIKDIKVREYTDTAIIGGMAFTQLVEKVLDTQSMAVDSVSGATASSNAFMTALTDCIEQAGGDIAVLKAREVEKRAAKTAEYDTDIVVIGAGMAGLTSAVQAATLGAKVILLEKNEVLSSSTTRSLGFVVGSNTEMQKASGIQDTVDALYDDIYSLYKDEPELDTTLLKKLCYDSTALNEFLLENGVEFKKVKNVSPKEPRATERTHVTIGGGAELSSTLLAKAENLGVEVMMGTPATDMLKDGDTVVGCIATNKYGDEITINASSVILCAGSYTNNLDMMKELNPRVTNAEYICGSGDGDAYNLTKSVGGDIVTIPYPQMMYYFFSPTWSKFPTVLPASPDNSVADLLLVDGGGNRVCSEDDFCFEYVEKVWNGGYDEGYCIVGQAFADKYPETIETALSSNVSASGLPFGYKAESIGELAENVEINPAALAATVERYNELCDKGIDEDFNKDAEYMVKIEAPYYILRLPQIATDGYTGARINEKSQVIDTNGNVIPGFYAAGSCASGQTTGVNYFGCGTSLLQGGVFGRAAAKDAVSNLNN